MASRQERDRPIQVNVDWRAALFAVQSGTAALLGGLARVVNPNFGNQDIRRMTPEEVAMSLQRRAQTAGKHLNQFGADAIELGLLGGPKAASSNPQAAQVAARMAVQEKIVGEIRFGNRPIIDEYQVAAMRRAGLAAAEQLRHAATIEIINGAGLDTVIQSLLTGQYSPEQIVEASLNAISMQRAPALFAMVRQRTTGGE